MPWIRSKKNGNVIEVGDESHAAQLVLEGHEAFVDDPRVKPKAEAWVPDAN